jgi:hypothetical protein
MRPDGNLVVYKANSDGDKPSDAVWASNTSAKGDANAVLAVQNDGNIVIYSGEEVAWNARRHHDSQGRLGSDKVNGDPTSGSTF